MTHNKHDGNLEVFQIKKYGDIKMDFEHLRQNGISDSATVIDYARNNCIVYPIYVLIIGVSILIALAYCLRNNEFKIIPAMLILGSISFVFVIIRLLNVIYKQKASMKCLMIFTRERLFIYKNRVGLKYNNIEINKDEIECIALKSEGIYGKSLCLQLLDDDKCLEIISCEKDIKAIRCIGDVIANWANKSVFNWSMAIQMKQL